MKKFAIPALFIALAFASCSKHFYAPALYNHDISYQPKPTSFDSSKTAAYVSLGGGFNQAVDIKNSISFAELDIAQGYAFNNVNLAYGAYGFIGAIDNSNHDNELKDPHSFDSKGFAGIGGRASVNMFKVIDNVNFRYIGVEASYSKEYGSFAAFRREVQNVTDYHASTRTEMFTIGGTSEVIWHARSAPGYQYALRLFLGKSIGDYSNLKTTSSDDFKVPQFPLYLSVGYFMQLKNFWWAGELTRNDISIPGIRVKAGYKF